MAKREVKQTGKDTDGDITALCNRGEAWSPRKKQEAIEDIDQERHEYFVDWGDKRTEVHVANDTTKGRYLRTDRDNTKKNNLEELPDC